MRKLKKIRWKGIPQERERKKKAATEGITKKRKKKTMKITKKTKKSGYWREVPSF